MLTRTNEFRARSARSNQRPLSATLLAAALAVVAAACLTLIAPIAWDAVKLAFHAGRPTLTQCAMVSADAERLACFDQLGKLALQPPAKGAYAPLVAR
jgi:histone H3/H4